MMSRSSQLEKTLCGWWRPVALRAPPRVWSIIAHQPLTTSVSVLHRVALSDPNKNLSGTLPCFATLISPLNLGLWQVRMLLVSLTFTYLSYKETFCKNFGVFKDISVDKNFFDEHVYKYSCHVMWPFWYNMNSSWIFIPQFPKNVKAGPVSNLTQKICSVCLTYNNHLRALRACSGKT